MSSMTTDELELAFRAHASELRSFLHRQLRNPEAAADLTQETYLRLLRQPPRKPVLNLRGFIFKIARNLAIDHARSRQTREHLDEGMGYLYEVTGESPALFDVVVHNKISRQWPTPCTVYLPSASKYLRCVGCKTCPTKKWLCNCKSRPVRLKNN